ncbi:MAG: LysM peptidoglycan-binding domain-containing protein [Chloroflexota bacterium]
MKRAAWLIAILFMLVLSGSSFFLFAQTDEPDSQPEPTPTPIPLPEPQVSIDWANIVLPEHAEFPAEMQQFTLPPEQIPAPNTQPQVVPIPAPQVSAYEYSSYIVAPGDTIYGIARKFGIPVQSIISANQISNPNLIHTGLVLQIPVDGSAPTPPPVESVPAPVPENGSSYTVRAGDSLYSIARQFSITVNALVQANQISNPSLIYPGTVLTIPGGSSAPPAQPQPPAPQPPAPEPAPPSNGGTTYLVKAGDSLNSIARQFGVSVDALAFINNISNWAVIYPGQVLTIPSADYVPPPPTQLPPSASGFIWPVNSRAIVQGFHGGHRAIDIVLPSGSSVVAITNGVIEFAGWNNHGYGNLIVINHGNSVRSLYAHNSTLLVGFGQQVGQGETLALSGNTGRSTMPHLHLEIMYDTFRLVNPCEHLPGGC